MQPFYSKLHFALNEANNIAKHITDELQIENIALSDDIHLMHLSHCKIVAALMTAVDITTKYNRRFKNF